MKNSAERGDFGWESDRGSFVFVCFASRIFGARSLSDGAAHSTRGATSVAARTLALVLLAAFYDGDDGKDGCREDDRRKHERDGKPRSRQRSKERVFRALIEYAVRKKLLHCRFLIR